MKACPRCNSVSKHRMKRRGVARFLPGAKMYSCDKCNAQYAWLSFINVSLRI